MRDRFLEGASSAPLNYKNAGLPNITATIGMISSSHNIASGAAYKFARVEHYAIESGFGSYGGVGFDASQSNSIYGRSETVQPSSCTVYYIIKVVQKRTVD